MGASVQFRGTKTILKAFENFQADAWAIFQAKNLLFKGIGSDLLEEILKSMEPYGSDAIYQLRVYEDIDDAKSIKDRTEADGSFSFKLGEEGSFSGGSSYVRSLEERIKKMESERDDDDDEDKTIGGRIGNALIGLLEQPNELIQLIGTLKQVFQPVPQGVASIGRVTTDFAPPVYSQPIEHPVPVINNQENFSEVAKAKKAEEVKPVEAQKEEINNLSDDQKITRLSAAITTLENADADILFHLEKLAKIATDSPQNFKMLVTMLDNFS
jgi:hypothetical protein